MLLSLLEVVSMVVLLLVVVVVVVVGRGGFVGVGFKPGVAGCFERRGGGEERDMDLDFWVGGYSSPPPLLPLFVVVVFVLPPPAPAAVVVVSVEAAAPELQLRKRLTAFCALF